MSLQSKKSPKKSVERNSCHFYLNFIFSKYGTVLQRIIKKKYSSHQLRLMQKEKNTDAEFASTGKKN